MEIELRQWCFGDEESLINIFDHYDRSNCDYTYPKPGECTKDNANLMIRWYVDIGYDGRGWARAIVLDGQVVGHIEYTRRPDIYDANCDLEIILLPEVCGKGVGSEAVRQMAEHAFYEHNHECVFITMIDSNKAAMRMAEKAGMHYCGIDTSCEWEFHGEPCTKVIYGIRRPKKEIRNTGVEIKPLERRDIDTLARLFETVDGRYDDVPDFTLKSRLWYRDLKKKEPTTEWLHEQLLTRLSEIVDYWNIHENKGDDIFRAIVNDGEIVGLISVRMQYGKQHADGLLGYMMIPEYCGKGIATKAVRLMLEEAFRLRELHRVTAWVYAPNVASSRVLEKNGFVLEGVLKEAVMCEGEPTDHLIFGLLKSKFDKLDINIIGNQLKIEL